MLVKGSGGIFDLACDGELVFSKDRDGAFPLPAQVVAALKSRRA